MENIDHSESQQPVRTDPPKEARSWLLPGVVGFLVLSAIIYFLTRPADEAPAVAPERPAAEPTVIETAPEITMAQPVTEPEFEEPVTEIIQLPVDATSAAQQAALASDLQDLSDSGDWQRWTAGEDLVSRFTVIIDNLAEGELEMKALPVPKPAKRFVAVERDESEYLDPAGYARYDSYAAVIKDLEPERMAELYREYLPLVDKAFAEFETTKTDVGGKIAESIDIILATPTVEGEIKVRRKGAIYLFSDPDLEALPGIQKLLIRMGPENAQIIKEKAAELKQALIEQGLISP